MDLYEQVVVNGVTVFKKYKYDDVNNILLNLKNNDKLLVKKNINIGYEHSLLKKYADFEIFTNSKIIDCTIDHTKIDNDIIKILEFLYNDYNDGAEIIKKSLLNIKIQNKNNDASYYYLSQFNIYIQIDNNKCILEIIKHCIEKNKSVVVDIQLENNKCITINFKKNDECDSD